MGLCNEIRKQELAEKVIHKDPRQNPGTKSSSEHIWRWYRPDGMLGREDQQRHLEIH